MLTRLRLKNWRSLKEETIEFTTPITVFIGANSSGKTNIVDALRFYHDSLIIGLVQAVLDLGYLKIQTDALDNNEDVELGVTYSLSISPNPIVEDQILRFEKRDVPFQFGRKLYEGTELLRDEPLRELPIKDIPSVTTFGWSPEESKRWHRSRDIIQYITPLVQKRWQFLSDAFAPPLRLSQREGGDVYVIEPDAHNILRILDFMRNSYPNVYDGLRDDTSWLLDHVSNLELVPEVETRSLRLLIRESSGKGAPTVSSGTIRLVAILTAIYALDMAQEYTNGTETKILTPDMPGIVIIEEPDTALNPGLLQRFVGQLRNYTEREGHPRQFILTTHNPAFLDFFEPEEVRVVERDEQGYSHVRQIPDYIKDIWLDKYALGEVWTTNSFGGLPE